MKRLLALIATMIMTFALLLATSNKPVSAAAEDLDRLLPIERCLALQPKGHSQLAVLFLIDISKSLRTTDTANQRSVALNAAIAGLAASAHLMGGSRKISAEFLTFGSTTHRLLPERDEWAPIWAASPDQLRAEMDALAGRTESPDTDYAAALEPWSDRSANTDGQVGAIEILERAPGGACRVVVWLTDGGLEIEHEEGVTKTLHWAPSGMAIDTKAAAVTATLRAESMLCVPGGLVDRLRGEERDVTKGAPYVIGVGLGNADFGLLNRMATGTDGAKTCGDPTKTSNGEFVPAATATLSKVLFEAANGRPSATWATGTCSGASPVAGQPGVGRVPFEFPSSLTAFYMLITKGSATVAAYLSAPNGQRVSLDADVASDIFGTGTEIAVTTLSPTVRVVAVTTHGTGGSWSGAWHVDYCAKDSLPTAPNQVALYLFGVLEPQLRHGEPLRVGQDGEIVVELMGGGGTLKTEQAWTDVSNIEVHVGDVLLPTPPISPDGAFHFHWTPPAVAAEPVPVRVSLQAGITLATTPPTVTNLPKWEGVIGTIEVREVPHYPIIVAAKQFEALRASKLSTTATLRATAGAGAGGGCLELRSSPGVVPPAGMVGSPTVTVFIGSERIEPSTLCAVRIDAGDSRDIRVEVAVTHEQLDVQDELLTLSLAWRSTSEDDPSIGETLTNELVLRVVRPTVTKVDHLQLAVLLGLVLLPSILLVLYNLGLGARFLELGTHEVAIVPVRVHGSGVTRSGAATASPLLTPDDFETARPMVGRQRQWTIAALTFRAHPSRSPFGQPFGRASAGPSTAVVGSLGATPELHAQVGLNLGNIWLFSTPAVKGAPLTAWEGELTVVLKSVEDLPAMLTRLAVEVGERVTRHLATAASPTPVPTSASSSHLPD